MRRVLLIFTLLLTACCPLLSVSAQDTIARNGGSVKVNGDGSVTVTVKSGKTFKLTPQASLPESCSDGQLEFQTAVGLQQCVSGAWQSPGADLSGYVQSSRTINSHPLSADVTISKADVNLGSADNTSDANKPVSTAQQTALNAKLNAANPAFTGTLSGPRVVTPSVALTDASTIATDASLGNYFRVTLGGNRTLGNPTNASDGQRIIFEFIQDGTGSRTLAYDTKFAFGTDITAATLTTTINKRDFLTVIYNSTADKFYVVGFVKGY
jgi:hypothetical protein